MGLAPEVTSTPTPPVSWIQAELMRVELYSLNATATPLILVISQPCSVPLALSRVLTPTPLTSLIVHCRKADRNRKRSSPRPS